MGNGKPGDHPYTDILVHGKSSYGDVVISLVKEMAASPGYSQISEEVSSVLIKYDPSGQTHPESTEFVGMAIEELMALYQRIQ